MLLIDSKTSSPPDSSPMASSTGAALKTSARATSKGSRSAISSPDSACGPLRFVAPAGQTTDLFGPVPVRANLSARQAKELGFLTSGTYGRPSIGSSRSAALQSSLVNRLQALTLELGSTLYAMTWKAWPMPSGRSLSRLRASVRRTSGTGPTGWPTPLVNNVRGPQKGPNREGGMCLGMSAAMAGWPTPSASIVDAKPRPPIIGNRKPTDPQIGLADVAVHLAAWQTPLSSDGQVTQGRTSAFLKGREALSAVECLPTMQPARLTAHGDLLTGSSAGMDGGGQLSPAHSRWLMDCPEEWDRCSRNFDAWQSWQAWIGSLSLEQRLSVSAASADTAMPSTPQPPAPSSKP